MRRTPQQAEAVADAHIQQLPSRFILIDAEPLGKLSADCGNPGYRLANGAGLIF